MTRNEQLAAELSEADIGEIIRHKAPAAISGASVDACSVSYYDMQPAEPFVSVSLHVGSACSAGCRTFAAAATEIYEKLSVTQPSPEELRAQAATLIERAVEIEKLDKKGVEL